MYMSDLGLTPCLACKPGGHVLCGVCDVYKRLSGCSQLVALFESMCVGQILDIAIEIDRVM